MDVSQWMKRPVYSLKPLDSLQHAREVMATRRVNQLPVVVDKELVGIITDRDLRDAFPSVFDTPLFGGRKARVKASDPHLVTVEMVMTSNVRTIGPSASMADAARLMRSERIGALPVVDKGRLVGIIARSDVLDCFVETTGRETERKGSTPAATAGARRAVPRPVTRPAPRAKRR